MTLKEAQELKDHDNVTDGHRPYHCRIHHHNKHDLWFWWYKIGRHKELITRDGGRVTRVYLGSKNVKASNIDFLNTLKIA